MTIRPTLPTERARTGGEIDRFREPWRRIVKAANARTAHPLRYDHATAAAQMRVVAEFPDYSECVLTDGVTDGVEVHLVAKPFGARGSEGYHAPGQIIYAGTPVVPSTGANAPGGFDVTWIDLGGCGFTPEPPAPKHFYSIVFELLPVTLPHTCDDGISIPKAQDLVLRTCSDADPQYGDPLHYDPSGTLEWTTSPPAGSLDEIMGGVPTPASGNTYTGRFCSEVGECSFPDQAIWMPGTAGLGLSMGYGQQGVHAGTPAWMRITTDSVPGGSLLFESIKAPHIKNTSTYNVWVIPPGVEGRALLLYQNLTWGGNASPAYNQCPSNGYRNNWGRLYLGQNNRIVSLLSFDNQLPSGVWQITVAGRATDGSINGTASPTTPMSISVYYGERVGDGLLLGQSIVGMPTQPFQVAPAGGPAGSPPAYQAEWPEHTFNVAVFHP